MGNIELNETDELVRRTDKGYLLEVDVSYPRDLHDLHNDLPFMCERLKIGELRSWFPTCTTSKITSSTFERWIKHSPTD